MTKTKRLLLVYPKNQNAGYSENQSYVVLGKKGGFMSASLATVAALTPADFEIRMIDEAVEPIDFDQPYDVVGITGLFSRTDRATAIAREFSRRGSTVVCGGPSVALNGERWRSIADVLIVGEAERIWPQFINDYLSGCPKPEYREEGSFDLSISPIPDYSGFSKKSIGQFYSGIVQTSRGCPFNCEFCSVHVYLGHTMRYKPIGQVIEEVQQLHDMGFRFVFLADDNFAGNRKKAKVVLAALREWNSRQRKPMSFATQLSVDAAADEEFLKLAAEAGLFKCVIGIESPNRESLEEAQKLHNVRSNVVRAIRMCHQHGIMVEGSTIVGFDHDDLSIFERQFDFFMNTGIVKVMAYPLQAYDGTRLKERMIREGRYVNREPRQACREEERPVIINFDNFNIVPKQMTTDELRRGGYWLVWRLYQPENILRRLRMFFEDFERSQKRTELAIPKMRLEADRLKTLWRLFLYLLWQASWKERAVFGRLVWLAMRYSYPKRFQVAIAAFFMGKKIRETLLEQDPAVATIEYPMASGGLSPGP